MSLKKCLLCFVVSLAACGKQLDVTNNSKPTAPSIEQRLQAYTHAPDSLSEEQAKQLLLEGAHNLGPTHELVRKAADASSATKAQSLDSLKALLASSEQKIESIKRIIKNGIAQKDIPLLRFALRASFLLSESEQTKISGERKELTDFLANAKGLELSPAAQDKINIINTPVPLVEPAQPTHSNTLSLNSSSNKKAVHLPMILYSNRDPNAPVGIDRHCPQVKDCTERNACMANTNNQIDAENKNMAKIRDEMENFRDQISALESEQNRIRKANEPAIKRYSELKQKRSEYQGRLEVAQMNLTRLESVSKQLNAINSRAISAELETTLNKALTDLSVVGSLAEFEVYDLLANAKDEESKKQIRTLLDIIQTVGLNASLSEGTENSSIDRLNSNKTIESLPSSILPHFFAIAKSLAGDLGQVEQSLATVTNELRNLQEDNSKIVASAEAFLSATAAETQSLSDAILEREISVSHDDDKIKVLNVMIAERLNEQVAAMKRKAASFAVLVNDCPKIACKLVDQDCW